jgi:chromosome segregation protein
LLIDRSDELKKSVDAASRQLDEVRARAHTADLAQSTASGKISLLENEQELATRKIDSLTDEKRTLEEQIKAADERVAHLEKELSAVRDELSHRQGEQASAEHDEKDARSQEEKAREQIGELKLAIATEQQRHDNLVAQREAMRGRDAELTELIAARQADIAGYENKLAAQANESRDAEKSIAEQTTRASEAEANARNMSDQRASRVLAVEKREIALRELRNSLSGRQEDRAQHQVRESQLQMQIQNLADHVGRRYHVDLREVASDLPAFEKTLRAQLKRLDKENARDAEVNLVSFPDADLQNVIADLTRQLDNMGPVNLEAVQEYDELEERYKFLEAQNTDLTNSRRELLEVIARINSTTKQMFAETFAQVRANFREMFAEMFGGGRADLSLMDENDPLNCGIEITAKPPGKQLQSILLLSGGERSMVAIALLFAIYMVRPSPFCVLDEIDAPLDETNINRFLSILARFVSESQFIIITHNKRTIAKADVLYGVTMEERGVSTLVTMKLTEGPADERSPNSEPAISSQRQFALAENGNGEAKTSFGGR